MSPVERFQQHTKITKTIPPPEIWRISRWIWRVYRDTPGHVRFAIISAMVLLLEISEVSKRPLTHNGKPLCTNTDRLTDSHRSLPEERADGWFVFSPRCWTLHNMCTYDIHHARPDMPRHVPHPSARFITRRLCPCANGVKQCRGWCCWGLKWRSDHQLPSGCSECLKFYKLWPFDAHVG